LAHNPLRSPALKQAFQDTVQLACTLSDAPYAMLCIMDANEPIVTEHAGLTEYIDSLIDSPIVGLTACEPEVVKIRDAQLRRSFGDGNNSAHALPFTSMASVPVFGAGDAQIGALTVFDSVSRDFSAGQISALQALSRQISVPIALLDYATTRDSTHYSDDSVQYRFADLLAHSSDMITIVAADGTIMSKSPSVERILGYQYGELVDRNIFEFIHPDDADAVMRFKQAVLSTPGVSGPYHFRIRGKDGAWRCLESIANNVLINNATPAIVVNSRDVTKRHDSEAELREANNRLQLLIATSPLAILSMDLESRITLWNPAAEFMFGWSADEILGKHNPVFHDEQPDEQSELLRETLQGRVVSNVDVRGFTKHGVPLEMRMSMATLRDSQGQVDGVMCVYVDMTEQKRVEAKLRQAHNMESAGRLAGGIAHDFNNLLTAIIGYSQLAESSMPDNCQAQDYLDSVQRAAERAAKLTQQLLAFSRKQLIAPKTINLDECLANQAHALASILGPNNRLVIQPNDGVGYVRVDPQQIEQVFVNLATNARDAMPDSGTLTIRTENAIITSRDTLGHGDVEPGEYVRITIADTGIGMAQAVKARVFEPFFTTKMQRHGTGLGLATCYGVIKQNGGYIWVESEIGQGAEFEILLPRVDKAPSVGGDAISEQSHCKTILLVEDEAMVRGILVQYLRGIGYTIIEAYDGENALSVVEHTLGSIDLLLTDVIMPGMGGCKLAETLYAKYPNMRMLFMSGYTDGHITAESRLPQGWGFIQKPFTPSVLAVKIREVFDKTTPA